MTLVVAALGKEAIWLLADRLLSWRGRPPQDDGCKIMVLETHDGLALLGYAGLGATAAGEQPSAWMSRVLRGRNWPLEQSLGALKNAMHNELPRHLSTFPSNIAPSHNVIVPAFVGPEARLYTIDVLLSPDRKKKGVRFVRHKPANGRKAPPLALGGSGALKLIHHRRQWARPLMRMVRAYDRRQTSAAAVARHLAQLNEDVRLVDRSVGDRCMVVWRHRKGGAHNGGGAHRFFRRGEPESESMILPTIARGGDLSAIAQVLWDDMMRRFKPGADSFFTSEPDVAAMNAKLAQLPAGPDEKLP